MVTDPNKENCPKSLEEISYIEPARFKEMIDCCQTAYTYDPSTNQYTLVVRYRPHQAVVFDQRFIKDTGLDFKEYEVSLLGRDKLIDPPSWDGPWEFPDWDY